MKRIFLVAGPLVLGIFSGIISFFYLRTNQKPVISSILSTQTPTKASIPPTAFSLEQAPQNSLKATITTLTNDVWWESRIATTPARLIDKISLQQGEALIASDSGQVTASFNDQVHFTLYPKTKVDLIQTLPVNLVFSQTTGTAIYHTQNTLISIRSLRLLTNLSEGSLELTIDNDTGKILVKLLTGQATLAFNNAKFISQVISLSPGKVFEFNNPKRSGQFID